MDIPCPTPAAPEFIFELSDDAAAHNLDVLSKHEFSLRKALDANKGSPLGYGSEFRHPDELRFFSGLYPLWPQMEAILTCGSRWPLEELCKKDRQKDLEDTLTFGNHKGSSAKPDLLRNSVWQGCQVRVQFPHPSLLYQNDPRPCDGSNKHNGAEYDRRVRENCSQRQTHP
jgi:hypothetical protein